jgi:hypothetical protein
MERRIPMRKTKVFAVAAAALILAGVGGWVNSTINAGRTAVATPIIVQMDPFQEMLKAKGLPTSHYDDYSLIFN